jgi:ribosome assembly protein 1
LAALSPHIETGFQLAAAHGPLCAEPMEGLAFFIENLEIDAEGLQKEMCMLWLDSSS